MVSTNTNEGATLLQQARLDLGWKQSKVIAALTAEARRQRVSIAAHTSLKTMLSRWENGSGQPDLVYRRLFCAIYGQNQEELGFEDPQERFGRQSSRVAPSLDPETVEYFRNVLDQHIRADNLMGPQHLVDVVRAQATLLDEVLSDAEDDIRGDLLVLAYRYNEFAGWLYQDAGDTRNAMHYSDRAMDYALAIDSPTETAYLLMRKSNIANDMGAFDRALGLTSAALRNGSAVSPRVRALVLGQEARAHSLRGRTEEAARALDTAMHEITRPDAEADDIASYCTPAYIRIQAGNCWSDLQAPSLAIPIFERALSELPRGLRRDRGLCQTRLASAHAAQGDKENACRVGHQALKTVQSATSARALRGLRQLRERLAPWRRDEEVSELCCAIKRLTTVR
ncbi:hypothetical protein [Plantactinospora sp. BB1]|uniref:hypothetical protein n=1 Tax=Plantactinospora sp. BB1 TaxID=2071627 RepID=UPI00131F0777|nr:hypothetical protein [Plantactinospora sp. BB1]